MSRNKDQKTEYKKRHDEISLGLKHLLNEVDINEYSIFFDKETNISFAFQMLSGDWESQDLANNPTVKKWWDYMADIMEVAPDNSPISVPLEEVLYLD